MMKLIHLLTAASVALGCACAFAQGERGAGGGDPGGSGSGGGTSGASAGGGGTTAASASAGTQEKNQGTAKSTGSGQLHALHGKEADRRSPKAKAPGPKSAGK
ncbi:MAG: hypothetical protein JWQ73_1696 [Variovorax sp.]|jgi:hypothetical protein|nr:hypothetical protein [Variovorax sp.]